MNGSAVKLLFTEELRTQQLPGRQEWQQGYQQGAAVILGAGSECPQLLEENLMLKWYHSLHTPKLLPLKRQDQPQWCVLPVLEHGGGRSLQNQVSQAVGLSGLSLGAGMLLPGKRSYLVGPGVCLHT